MEKTYHQPLGGNKMPRFGGPATMMRLPAVSSAKGLDAAFVGVPFDIGTSNRSGARFGPRQIRAESCLIRPYNMATRAAPFDSLSVADIGDVAINTFNLEKSIAIIEAAYDEILSHNCIPMTIGGDHTIALPILRALKRKYGPVGMVHIDAHADVNDSMFGEPVAHGTPFRRAVEEGLLDGKRVAQIGLRATGYSAEDFDWPRSQGFRVVQAEECWYKSLAPLMREIKEQVKGGPVYLSLRHRRARPLLRARHRDTGDRRPHHHPGHGDHPRLPRPAAGRLRPGRGGAAVRSQRQHLAARLQPAVRDAVRAAGGQIPELGPFVLGEAGWLDPTPPLRLSVGQRQPGCRLSSAVEQPPCKR